LWFGVPVGNGRLARAELTDSQSPSPVVSLVVSREPAVGGVTDPGGSGATDPVGTAPQSQSTGVPESQSMGVPDLWAGCLVWGACQELPDIP
jgi:hypothetical protein